MYNSRSLGGKFYILWSHVDKRDMNYIWWGIEIVHLLNPGHSKPDSQPPKGSTRWKDKMLTSRHPEAAQLRNRFAKRRFVDGLVLQYCIFRCKESRASEQSLCLGPVIRFRKLNWESEGSSTYSLSAGGSQTWRPVLLVQNNLTSRKPHKY